jgi:hypothetical protein
LGWGRRWNKERREEKGVLKRSSAPPRKTVRNGVKNLCLSEALSKRLFDVFLRVRYHPFVDFYSRNKQ